MPRNSYKVIADYLRQEIPDSDDNDAKIIIDALYYCRAHHNGVHCPAQYVSISKFGWIKVDISRDMNMSSHVNISKFCKICDICISPIIYT